MMLSFFQSSKMMQIFLWMEECHQTFKELKKSFGSLSLLFKLEEGEGLYLYLTASLEAVTLILVRVDGKGA